MQSGQGLVGHDFGVADGLNGEERLAGGREIDEGPPRPNRSRGQGRGFRWLDGLAANAGDDRKMIRYRAPADPLLSLEVEIRVLDQAAADFSKKFWRFPMKRSAWSRMVGYWM
ncbi:hypothetical protein KL86PLE_100236 [uncultured Pleomorphomonas sp.]|uniref:Uncharacterized protein n=1 Tax=uncultured Pleomorphomonas sp. TaxID=442121 RepID=A0A212L1Q4_9HYPH|nr:hypothetical protein KL86PLE_100236 [uncultured Pleomorphomonas sp.]